MNDQAQAIRDALAALNLDVPAAALDRAAVAALAEIDLNGGQFPELVMVTGADWVTVKALPSADADSVGAIARGVWVQAGAPEGVALDWRPIYSRPLGYVKANMLAR